MTQEKNGVMSKYIFGEDLMTLLLQVEKVLKILARGYYLTLWKKSYQKYVRAKIF